MKTLEQYKKEDKNHGRRVFGRRFSPFRISFADIEDLKLFLGNAFSLEIEEAFNISREVGIITIKKQNKLKEMGFDLCFRGFNSHSGDVYVYQDCADRWFLNIGMSNINNAGRGYEVQI